jgi:hypothetical protein
VLPLGTPTRLGLFYFVDKYEEDKMARRQRVFQRGKEYEVTGSGKRHRRLVFMGGTRVDGGQEILIFRPVRKMKKHRS